MEYLEITSDFKGIAGFSRAPLKHPDSRIPSHRRLHVVALSAFAVAQPIYDRTAERVAFLQYQDVQTAELWILVGLISGFAPSLCLALEFFGHRLSQRTGDVVAALVNFVLFTAILLPWVKRLIFLPGVVILGIGLVSGAMATWSYSRFILFRQAIRFSAAGALIFPVWFLFLSDARAIAWPQPASNARVENPVPVVMVVFDEFCGESLMNDSREIDADRFPGFAELSRHSTWFRNATGVRPMTDHAVPALLSGNFRQDTVSPDIARYPQNLFSLLRNSRQYEIVAFEPISRLCPRNERQDGLTHHSILGDVGNLLPTLGLVYAYHLFPYDRPTQLPSLPRPWFQMFDSGKPDPARRRGVLRYRWGDNRNSQFDHFLECLSSGRKPVLNFCHLMLPHVPWCYLPSGRRYAADGPDWGLLELETTEGIETDWPNDDLYVVHHHARYLLQLQFADRLVQRLLLRLRQLDLFDRCLLIVVGDHGVSFRTQEPRRWLSDGNLSDIMPIPLFVKRPGQKQPAVSDRNVESVDILPTIADVLKITLPSPVDGASIFDDEQTERPSKTMNDSGAQFTVAAHPQSTDAALDLQLKRFGSGQTRPNGLFETGPHPELIGRRAEDLTVPDPSPIEIELLKFSNVYSPADIDALVPCFFEGRVRGASTFPTELAVTIDGTIQAVTRTYVAGESRITWCAMVPESCLMPGENDIRFYVVESSEAGLSLRVPVVRRAHSRAASANAP